MSMRDFQPSLVSFGRVGAAVTPSDSTDIPDGPVKAVVALSAGNLAVIPAGSAEAVAFVGISAGFLPPYQVRRVMATGTTVSVATVTD